jgi:hypothetical protein
MVPFTFGRAIRRLHCRNLQKILHPSAPKCFETINTPGAGDNFSMPFGSLETWDLSNGNFIVDMSSPMVAGAPIFQ